MVSGSIKKLFSIDYVKVYFSESIPISELAQPLYFPADTLQAFSIGSACWNLDPSKEAVSYNIKHTNKKFDV